ncbi:MAG: EAL domain-containing protein (putative c-di-GMP-specific phosphodiesterase class I) [Myxococcota bacterium]|jgi:EAL domain-containing protein (putative c-di-GMP-specific phosphodiesterase class I)/FixJ family two-component response regulator
MSDMLRPGGNRRAPQSVVAARVLLVDDDERTLRAMSAQLKRPENSIRTASSGLDALAVAREWRPDVILLDVMMPGVDGFEVCRRLRAEPEISDCRVFFASALDDRDSRLEGFEAGADDFLTKPLDREETLIRIEGIAKINRHRALIMRHRALSTLEQAYAMPPSVAHGLTREELGRAYDMAVGSLELFVQPIVEIGPDGQERIIAQEALMRTRRGELLPDPLSLLAAAARLDRLAEVGRTVRRLATKLFEDLPADQLLFVNTSSSELLDESFYDPTLPLAAHAHRVVLELTEREPLEKLPDVRARVALLRQHGFRFAVDDLGGGYSSLNTLAVLEPEFVKLDRVLVQGVADGSIRGKIIGSIVGLCSDLGVRLIAEGVETASERDALAKLGCRLQQGYHFARPQALLPEEL